MQRLKAAVEGRDTVRDLQRRIQAEPKNPEIRLKLGRKYQERYDREHALPLFLEAASLDPKRDILTRTDDGALVSCRDMAEYQHARTFIVTWGTIEPKRMRDFISTHPTSPLLRDAWLDACRFMDLSDAGERALFTGMLDRFPHDPDILTRLGQEMSRSSAGQATDTLRKSGSAYAEGTVDWLQKSSPAPAAKALADLRILSGDWDGAEAAYGAGFIAGQARSWAKTLVEYAEFWWLRKKNEAGAMAALKTALALSPEDAGVRQAAARVYLMEPPRMDEALAAYGPGWLAAPERTQQEFYDYFSFWMDQRANRESALAALDMLMAKSPDSLHYRRSAASVLWKAGESDRTQALFGPAYIARYPDRLAHLFEYGMFWLARSSHTDTAKPALIKAVSDPIILYANKMRAANELGRTGHGKEAEAIYGPATLEAFAGNMIALKEYARFWTGRKTNPEAALKALEMIEKLPGLEWFDRNQAAALYLELGRKDKAEAIYGPDYLKAMEGDASKQVYYAQFWHYRRLNLFSAMEAAQSAVRTDPKLASGWAVLADLLQVDGKQDEALRAIEKAISLTGDDREKARYEQRRAEISAAGIKKAP